MVTITKDRMVYFKILYWGPLSGGKTTAVETLFKICLEQDKEFIHTIKNDPLTIIYFDRGLIQINREKNVFFKVFTVAGQSRWKPLRKKVFIGTDGVIFVADSQRSRLQDNIDGLKELKRVSEGDLIKKIPILVMLNKRDLDDLISVEEWEEIMKDEGLLLPKSHDLELWNPITYETVALPGQKQKNIYSIFSELVRRCIMYQVYGDGNAPSKSKLLI